MNSSYVVGAEFRLLNLVSPELTKIAEDMTRLDTKLEKSKLAFIERIEKMAGSFDLLGPAADKASAAMAGAMGKAETDIGKISTEIAGKLSGAFTDADAAADRAANGMITAMKRAEEGVRTQAGEMGKDFASAFTGLGSGLSESVDGITRQFSRITRSANNSSRAVDNLKRQIRSLSEIHDMPMPQLPAAAGGMRGRGGHRGGLGHSSSSLSLGTSGHREIAGARVHGSGGGMAGLVGAGLVVDGLYEAAELEDIVTKVLITSQMNPGEQPLTRNKDGGKIAEMIKRGAVVSGASIKDVGEMFLSTEREFQGFDFEKKISTMQLMMPSIAAEARLREESLEEAGKSLIGVLHQAGLIEPADMVKGAKEFQFTTMATPVGLEQFKGALSYAMPLHNQIGMDTGTIMLMTSLMQSSGITNTKSGTWLDAMFTKAQPETDVLGPLKKEQIQHNNALKMLGLIGDDGKQNWHVMGADGKEDWSASALKFS